MVGGWTHLALQESAVDLKVANVSGRNSEGIGGNLRICGERGSGRRNELKKGGYRLLRRTDRFN